MEQDPVLKILTNIELKLDQVQELSEENVTKVIAMLEGQNDLTAEFAKSGSTSRKHLKKEITQLQGFILAVTAIAVFLFGHNNEKLKEDLITSHGSELVSVILAGYGGYKAYSSREGDVTEEEE